MQIKRLLPLIVMLATSATAHAECGQDSSDEAVKACLTQDLRDSDRRINAVYKSLQETSDEASKVVLRDEQRAWLKSRDKACRLSNKESDREKWLQSVLASQEQTVCVVRFTFSRVAQLDQNLKQRAPGKTVDAPAAPRAPEFAGSTGGATPAIKLPASVAFVDDGYKARTVGSHERGKWYYEVWIDRARIAESGDLLLVPGYATSSHGAVRMVNVRRSQANMPPMVIGLALDLDGGYVYIHQDGAWKIAPGAAGAAVMPLTGPYVGVLQGSSSLSELIERGLLKVNVGEAPFKYAPAGYRAWGEN